MNANEGVLGQNHHPLSPDLDKSGCALDSHADVSIVSDPTDDRELVPSRQQSNGEDRLRLLRTKWDVFWDHPCAGDRCTDGSAIFCCACDHWVSIPEPFDHATFEFHCQRTGHSNWIYGR